MAATAIKLKSRQSLDCKRRTIKSYTVHELLEIYMTSPIEEKIDDWQKVVNKPVFTRDGKDIGVVESIQAEKIIATFGPITPTKYLIPKSSIIDFDEMGVVRLKEDGDFVEHHYKFA